MRCLCYAATATALYASCRGLLQKGGRWWGAAGLLVSLPLVAVLGWGDPWVLLVVAGLAAALALSIHQWRCAMSFDATAGLPGDGLGSAPRALRWLLPGITVILTVLAVGQVAWFVPRCVWAVQRFGVQPPWYLVLLWQTPFWLVAAAAVAAGVLACWQRRSVARSTLIAAAALVANLAVLLCVCGAQARLFNALNP